MNGSDDTDDRTGISIDRRDLLKAVAAGSAAGFVGVPALGGSAVAAESSETLYLSDTGGDDGFSDGESRLFEVDLVDGDPPQAQLTELQGSPLPTDDFGQVDAIAATPDGETIDVIDKNSAHLGRYTVSDGSFSDEGKVDGLLSSDAVVLASYSPDGTLYAAGQGSGALYTVDPSGPTVTSTTGISGATVQGADLAFDASGTLYLYSSADQRLYTVDPDTGEATLVGDSQTDKGSFTGLAIRDAGAGNLVGSSTSDNTVYVLDTSDGSKGTGYRMYEDGSAYAYGYGDMTVGALEEPCAECESGTDLLAKFEWESDGDGTFREVEEDENIEFLDATLDDDGEPTEACFGVDYCEVAAVVKAGTEEETSTDDGDGEFCVSAIEGENPNGKSVTYAISNVRFYCEVPEEEAPDDTDDDDDDGEGSSGEDADKGHGNNEGDDPDNPGNDDGDPDDGNSGHGDDGSNGGGNGNGRGP